MYQDFKSTKPAVLVPLKAVGESGFNSTHYFLYDCTTRYILSQNCDFFTHLSFSHDITFLTLHISHHFCDIRFPKRKHFFKPDYLDGSAYGRGGGGGLCTRNPST